MKPKTTTRQSDWLLPPVSVRIQSEQTNTLSSDQSDKSTTQNQSIEQILANLQYNDLENQKIAKSLICNICERAFHNPVTTECGHTFCKTCLDRSFQINRLCPNCRQECNKVNSAAFVIKDMLDEILCKCTWCDWTGSREIYRSHLYECDLIEVICPYGCSKMIHYRYMDAHTEICTSRSLFCKCGLKIKDGGLEDHFNLDCPTVKTNFNSNVDHEPNLRYVINQLFNRISSQQDIIEQQSQRIAYLEDKMVAREEQRDTTSSTDQYQQLNRAVLMLELFNFSDMLTKYISAIRPPQMPKDYYQDEIRNIPAGVSIGSYDNVWFRLNLLISQHSSTYDKTRYNTILGEARGPISVILQKYSLLSDDQIIDNMKELRRNMILPIQFGRFLLFVIQYGETVGSSLIKIADLEQFYKECDRVIQLYKRFFLIIAELNSSYRQILDRDGLREFDHDEDDYTGLIEFIKSQHTYIPKPIQVNTPVTQPVTQNIPYSSSTIVPMVGPMRGRSMRR